jgi:hypothetical protein
MRSVSLAEMTCHNAPFISPRIASARTVLHPHRSGPIFGLSVNSKWEQIPQLQSRPLTMQQKLLKNKLAQILAITGSFAFNRPHNKQAADEILSLVLSVKSNSVALFFIVKKNRNRFPIAVRLTTVICSH